MSTPKSASLARNFANRATEPARKRELAWLLAKPAAAAARLSINRDFFTINRTCPACQGAGQIIKERCADCHGQGRMERERTIELRIPPGVDTGTRLRVQGKANLAPTADLPAIFMWCWK